MKLGKQIIVITVVALLICTLVLFDREISNKVVVPKEITDILLGNAIIDTKITKLGDYSKVAYSVQNSNISEEEIKDYIDIQMESYEEIVEVTDREIVHNGDVVYVSYIVMCEGEVINQVEHDNLMVGTGAYDIQFEQALIGKNIGQAFTVTLSLKDVYGELRECDLNIVIESINYFRTYELTDQFVQDKFGMSSVKEYYMSCYDTLKAEKNKQAETEAKDKLFREIIDMCEFQINCNEIVAYSMDVVEEHEQLAYVYEMDLDGYVKEVLGTNIDEFYQDCYDYGEYAIKKYLVVGAIFNDLKYEITESECEEMKEELGYGDEVVSIDTDVNNFIKYNIMEKKVIDYFINKS